MKIRSGFVSNSSSSSFCIWGIYLDLEQYQHVPDGDELLENLKEKVEVEGIFEWHSTPWNTVAVGRSFRTIKNDETGAQFKQSVSDKLKELSLPTKCGVCEESWYDG